MDNYEKILHMTREEMTDFINLLIDEGDHLIADDLSDCGIPEINDSTEEVLKWLEQETLE